MKSLKCLLAAPLFAGLAFSLYACNDERPQAKIIVVDQKMPLIEWPDSIYVNSLDSILALEPVKKSANEKKDVNLTFNSKSAPVFKLPSSVTGKPEKKPAGKDMPANRPANRARPPRRAEATTSPARRRRLSATGS